MMLPVFVTAYVIGFLLWVIGIGLDNKPMITFGLGIIAFDFVLATGYVIGMNDA